MCLAVGAVDRSRRNHHHRNEPAINEHAESHVDDHGAVYYDQQPVAPIDAFDRAIDEYLCPAVFNERTTDDGLAYIRVIYNAAAAVLAVDVAVDSAGDRMSGPADNTLRRLRDEWLDTLADYNANPNPLYSTVVDAARAYTTARDRNR